MKHNFRTQLPPVVWQAVILECESSPYTLGIFTNEKDAIARLEVARKQIVCDTPEPIWMYVLTVKDGTVVSRRDLSLENPIAEVYASCS